MSTILVYGDSNSHGTPPLVALGDSARFDKAHRWPSVMADDLGPAHDVICEALPGRTTVHDDVIEGGMRNGLTVLPAMLQSHKPIDLVVLMLGTNDLKIRFSVSAWEIARSLERLVSEIQLGQPQASICVVAPANVREIGTLRDVFAEAETRQVNLSNCIKEMTDRTGLYFVDANDHVSVSEIDGVHWDAEQHVIFGKVMADKLRTILESQ